MSAVKTRSPISITYNTWKALFLREAVGRMSAKRLGWFWMIGEPLILIVIITFIFTVIRMRTMLGLNTALWIMSGLLAYYLFRRSGVQGMNALAGNMVVFTYRQVKPVDAVFVNTLIEGILNVLVAVFLFFFSGLFELYGIASVIPSDPLLVLESLFGLWLLALGFGLVNSVPKQLINYYSEIMSFFLAAPLYISSGVVFPVNLVPEPYRSWLYLNPIIYGVEGTRLGFSKYYHPTVPEIDMVYLYVFALTMICFGLILHRHYADRLVER